MRGASRTAEAVCFLRALEARRPDPVVVDAHAAGFLRPTWRPLLSIAARALPLWDVGGGWPGIGAYVAARHRWFDDRIAAAIASGTRELIVLGAGYDSRARRFPDARTWEVDHPATSARKWRIAADHPARRVQVDFERQSLVDELVRAGFPEGARAFVVWEGVTMYLSRDAVRGTLRALHGLLGPGSEIAFDAFRVMDEPGIEAHVHRLSPTLMPIVGEPVTFFLHPDDAPGLLASEGWTAREVVPAAALQRALCPERVVYPPMFVARATR